MSIELFKEYFTVDYESGLLYWCKSVGNVSAGSRAGSKNKAGYYRVKLNNKEYYVHRIIYSLHIGRIPNKDIDHINGNKGDNRLCNLREVTMSQNLCNTGKYSNNTTGVKGVSYYTKTGKYVAELVIDGKRVLNKSFDNLEDAKSAVEFARLIHHKDYRRVI